MSTTTKLREIRGGETPLVPELGPASRIGRYQLVAPIGAGGMGKVWVALDTAAPGVRLVALKTALGTESGTSADFWATLTDEASLASRIEHPNVCATYELGHEQGLHFLVMEWSDGTSLRNLLDASPNKRIAPELAALICARIAAGLHAAHELTDEQGESLNVVHRDVSPQNVLVSMRGHVRLADFGVAKARGQQQRPTETGEIKGKLSYMAPEQITSKQIDRRADVFALGCVLYEASLGVRPFHGGDPMATMYKILEAPLLSPRALDPLFPEALERVLFKAMAKDPQDRYATAEELGAALIDFLSSTRRSYTDRHIAELLQGPLGEQLRERNQQILASAEQLRRGETDPRRLHSPAPPPPNGTLTPEGGVERSIAFRVARPRAWKHTPLALVLAGLGVGAILLIVGMAQRSPARVENAIPFHPATAPATSAEEAPPERIEVAAPPPLVRDTPPSPSPSSAPARPAPSSPSPRTNRPAAPLSDLRPLKTPVKKPRPIDRDNPFADP